MSKKKIKKSPSQQELAGEITKDVKKSFEKTYQDMFKKKVWQKLSTDDKKALCQRFEIKLSKLSIKQLLKSFKLSVLPRAFCIAAIAKLNKPAKSVYDLIKRNPYKHEYKQLITYDDDKWGIRRKNNQPYLGIFDRSKTAVSKTKRAYLEYLLRCSISLNKAEKITVIQKANELTTFQIVSLIKVFEEEMDQFYLMDSFAKQEEIHELVKDADKAWHEIVDLDPITIRELSYDSENIPTPKAFATMLEEYVKGQKEAVKSLSISLYYQKKVAKAFQNKKKLPFQGRIEPILLNGPTGSGKSYLVKKAAQLTGLSFVHVDASSLVSTGIKGYGVNDALKNLIRESKYDLAKAQCGIIYFDEIDKLLVHHDGLSILSQLLRVVEGSHVMLETNSQAEEKEFSNIKSIDTFHIFFILGGSFEMQQNQHQSGFVKTDSSKISTRHDLLQAGIPKELIGRVEEIIVLEKLTKEDLKEIVLTAKESPLVKYRQMLALNGKSLELEEKVLDDILNTASQSPYGARTLNALLKQQLKTALFEIEGKK